MSDNNTAQDKVAPIRTAEMTESNQAEQLGNSATDNRSLFIEAMADPIRRRIAFDVVERNCRMRFRMGEDGVVAYLQVLELVQLSQVDEAVEEFEKRFLPMLDQKSLKSMVERTSPEQ